jgi:hypothetical protein
VVSKDLLTSAVVEGYGFSTLYFGVCDFDDTSIKATA